VTKTLVRGEALVRRIYLSKAPVKEDIKLRKINEN